MQRDTERNKEWKRRSLSRRQELDILRIIGSFMVEGLQHVRALFLRNTYMRLGDGGIRPQHINTSRGNYWS